MHIPHGTTPDPDLALAFLAWELGANNSVTPAAYSAEIRRACSNGTIYVASDSLAAALLFERTCPSGAVVRLPPVLGTRVHSETRTSGRANRSSVSSSLVDWLMLSRARNAVRFGAQHSSFVTSAALMGCGVKTRRTPKSWRYKAAGSWLLGKVLHKLQSTAQATGSDCTSVLAPMLQSTPCATPCLSVCQARIYRAYA